MMMRWLGRLLACLIVAVPLQAQAQQSLRAAAVVNDEVISILDLRMRMKLVALTSGIANDPQQIRRLAPQVLRNLINERIQLQEARRLEIEVTESEIRDARRRIAQRNDISLDQFVQALERNGIMPETFNERVRATIAWQKVLAREVRPDVNISAAEVAEVVERRQAQAGQRLLRMREIFLPTEDDNTADVRDTAQRLMQELRNGANFDALARQFSQSATAAVGGDLGWMTPDALPDELAERAADMSTGSIAGPVETFGGIYILGLQDAREGGAGSTRVTLKQILLPTNGAADTGQLREEVNRLAARVNACGDVESVAEAHDSAQSVDLGTLELADMPDGIRRTVGSLEVGEVSEPIEAGGGIGVVVVCDRETPGLDREQIRENLVRQRLDMLARRYMRDLRRQAFVDIRVSVL
jgi:peptidyl-prolyl cis-trans isomerase SurA